MTEKALSGNMICLDTDARFRSVKPPPHVPGSFLDAGAALGLPMPGPTEPRSFSFHRSKRGARVWLHHGRLAVNLSAYDVAPAGLRFPEARAWAASYARDHGFVYREQQR